jgi:hypothetical protein
MVPVDLSLLELAPVQPREKPVSFAYEKWLTAGSRRRYHPLLQTQPTFSW